MLRLGVVLLASFITSRTIFGDTRESGQPILGFLENRDSFRFGKSGHFVRIAFKEENGHWKAFDHAIFDPQRLHKAWQNFPARVQWLVINDKCVVVGSFTSINPGVNEAYSTIGTHLISAKTPLPATDPSSGSYIKWDGTSAYGTTLLSTVPPAQDPSHWKRSSIPDGIRSLALSCFRQTVRFRELCSGKVGHSHDCSDSKIVTKNSYVAKRNAWIVSIQLVDDCGDSDDPESCNEWFYISPPKVIYLGHSMMWLTAADFGRDGQSEVIFRVEGDNTGGYVVFAQPTLETTSFWWNYH